MQLRINNLRSLNKYLAFIFLGFISLHAALWGQDLDSIVQTTSQRLDSLQLGTEVLSSGSVGDSIRPFVEIQEPVEDVAELVTEVPDKVKIDGVAAVVGDYIILDSDVDKALIELKSQGVATENISRCELAGSLLENKLYAHHAIQDSLPISDAEIEASVQQQLDYLTSQIGSMDKVLEFYKQDDEDEFRKELYTINKTNRLAQTMQRKVIEEVEITPEEVRNFFEDISKDEKPIFGTELEVAQIIIEPEIPEEERQKAIARLEEMRKDVVENGASFASKAVLYSQDPGSRSSGGLYTLARTDPFAKEFRDKAFGLQEGEVSEPFETEFGFHILFVDKVRGQKRDVRHILLVPDVTNETIQKAKVRIDSIRQNIMDKKYTFAEAARSFSDEKETKEDGGKLINPVTGNTRFELTKIDPVLYDQVSKLKSGEISKVIPDQDRRGRKKFKIITVSNRFDEHEANYSKDYFKIKELALKDKQLKAIEKWQEEKIDETYIKVNGDYRNCEYASNWLKK